MAASQAFANTLNALSNMAVAGAQVRESARRAPLIDAQIAAQEAENAQRATEWEWVQNPGQRIKDVLGSFIKAFGLGDDSGEDSQPMDRSGFTRSFAGILDSSPGPASASAGLKTLESNVLRLTTEQRVNFLTGFAQRAETAKSRIREALSALGPNASSAQRETIVRENVARIAAEANRHAEDIDWENDELAGLLESRKGWIARSLGLPVLPSASGRDILNMIGPQNARMAIEQAAPLGNTGLWRP